MQLIHRSIIDRTLSGAFYSESLYKKVNEFKKATFCSNIFI